MTDTLENFKKQHLSNYKNAVIDLVKNNTDALIDNDIISLIKSPPLDSMDVIKSKLLSLAKKEKVILDSSKMNFILNNFRDLVITDFQGLKKIRNNYLVKKIEEFEPVRENEIIKIMKKDLDSTNKEIKKTVKMSLNNNINNKLLIEIADIYDDQIDEKVKESIMKLFSKYMKTTYIKQLNENISIKILVKDRTLLSLVAEQGERYLFTKANSHIFDE